MDLNDAIDSYRTAYAMLAKEKKRMEAELKEQTNPKAIAWRQVYLGAIQKGMEEIHTSADYLKRVVDLSIV